MAEIRNLLKGAFASYEKARSAIQAVLARKPDLTQGLIQLANLNGRFASAYNFLSAACSAYGHAQNLYRENECRRSASQIGRKQALELAHEMKVCIPRRQD